MLKLNNLKSIFIDIKSNSTDEVVFDKFQQIFKDKQINIDLRNGKDEL